MHIEKRLGCTAKSGIWGHAYEASTEGEHGVRLFPWVPLKDEPARAAACENTRVESRPWCAACNFPRQGDPMGVTDLVWEPTKATPSGNLARRNCQNNSKIDYEGDSKKYNDTDSWWKRAYVRQSEVSGNKIGTL